MKIQDFKQALSVAQIKALGAAEFYCMQQQCELLYELLLEELNDEDKFIMKEGIKLSRPDNYTLWSNNDERFDYIRNIALKARRIEVKMFEPFPNIYATIQNINSIRRNQKA